MKLLTTTSAYLALSLLAALVSADGCASGDDMGYNPPSGYSVVRRKTGTHCDPATTSYWCNGAQVVRYSALRSAFSEYEIGRTGCDIIADTWVA